MNKLRAALLALIFSCLAPVANASLDSSCGPAFSALATGISALRELPPLAELVAGAGLKDQVGILRASGKAVIDAKDFLIARKGMGQGYLLAVDGINYTSEIFSSNRGLLQWPDGYREFRIFPKMNGHTPVYLSKIVATEKPIVFLVPPNLMSEPGITQNEMKWFLEDPARMKNVTFVFGAYNLFPDEVLKRFNRNRDRTEIRRLMGE